MKKHAARKQVLKPGHNCWLLTKATNAGLVVDGEAYYRAFYEAALCARRYILIAGWRFNSDVRLLRGHGKDVKFIDFLEDLCQKNSDLHIYILAWKYSMIFRFQWEWFQEKRFGGTESGRIHFRYDDQHAVGASHHQKFVVVDGKAAFVGGLDFNADDWDDRRHLASNPERHDSGHEPHPPYHDVQAYVTGPVAAKLTAYFKRRWQMGAGEELTLPRVTAKALPAIETSIPLPPGPVALSRSEPFTLNDPKRVMEIRQLYLDAIDAAEELIYLENQYFSSQAVFRALQDRMAASDRPQLDIVIVLPRRVPSWLEDAIHGPPRLRMLDALTETARRTGHRLGFYYGLASPPDGEEAPITLHSKVLIVDDLFLTVGSANTSNRSMGLDTELNLAWEARSPSEELAEAIRRVRINLLTEHCGWPKSKEVLMKLEKGPGLVTALDEISTSRSYQLRILTSETICGDREWLRYLGRSGVDLDPGRPLIDENLFEALNGSS